MRILEAAATSKTAHCRIVTVTGTVRIGYTAAVELPVYDTDCPKSFKSTGVYTRVQDRIQGHCQWHVPVGGHQPTSMSTQAGGATSSSSGGSSSSRWRANVRRSHARPSQRHWAVPWNRDPAGRRALAHWHMAAGFNLNLNGPGGPGPGCCPAEPERVPGRPL